MKSSTRKLTRGRCDNVKLTGSAHKAADPDGYPIREDVRAMLPSLKGIEKRFGPTNVHLQVYDGEFAAGHESNVRCMP